jgi:hypothetical protein
MKAIKHCFQGKMTQLITALWSATNRKLSDTKGGIDWGLSTKGRNSYLVAQGVTDHKG